MSASIYANVNLQVKQTYPQDTIFYIPHKDTKDGMIPSIPARERITWILHVDGNLSCCNPPWGNGGKNWDVL